MASERERLKLKQLKLALVREGKATESLLGSSVSGQAVVGCGGFGVAGNLRLLHKFNERTWTHFFLCLNGLQMPEGGLILIEP